MPLEGDDLFVNMGPQHPSTHGVLRLALQTDGEIVKCAKPQIGYLHRCFEKSAEGVLWEGIIPFTDRMDYVGAIGNEWPLVLGIESLLKHEVPERGEYCRVIAAEIQRIASHLLAFGTYGIDIGAITPFMHAFRDREKALDILEYVSGARLLYNYIRPGGVMSDFGERSIEMIRLFLDDMERRIPEYHQLLTYNRIFIERTAHIGVITKEQALSYNMTGPNLRACGVDWDLRRDDPYSIYNKLDWDVVLGTAEHGELGDCWNRYIVRLIEVEESISIIRQAIDLIPEGETWNRKASIKIPVGEIYSRAESSRGEVGYYIIANGQTQAFRVKAKSPCFCVLAGFEEITKNMLLADVVATMGSIDIVLGEVDR
ncbi:MAG: NADH-quinone oxidoreductase subunit D [Candidatus Lindowbacteria bacterium]|nr:NADH-quinone oxidoreductase subunit D [Candidatus Lindowbacteria bacterium]